MAHPSKKIAFLSFDWDFEIVSEYYLGLQHAVSARDDIQIFIFSAFGHHQDNYEPDKGSHKIFTLCDLSRYDGFLIQGNRTWPPELRQSYVDAARALGKPVVSINYRLEGAHTVSTNNYQAMYDLVYKVLCDQGRTRPAFVNGLATSIEAQRRAQGYRDACTALGLADAARFYQANWQIESGRAAAECMLAEESLPDAIFCCNDDLAVGLMETLQAHGVRVPEDVMVTGFDNREISRRTIPHITTIDRDYSTIAQAALTVLEQLIEDDHQAMPYTYSPYQFILRRSSGYESDDIARDKELYTLDNSLKLFYERLSNFQTEVFNSSSLYDIFKTCEVFSRELACPNVFVSISSRYLQFDSDKPVEEYSLASHLMAHFGPAVSWPCNSKHIYASYLTEALLPPKVAMNAPLYVVLPLRQGEACIGNVVTEGVSRLTKHGFLAFCLTLLSASIESARRHEMLKMANARLNDLYVHDELTGLFNRFGLDRFGEIIYLHLLEDYGETWLTFVDVDKMKDINDRYGHDAGDQALRETANVIRHATLGENAFAMRYGGDEFLIISQHDPSSPILRGLKLVREGSRHDFKLSLSIGAKQILAENQLPIEEAIRAADAAMYVVKKRRDAALSSMAPESLSS